MEKIDFKKKYKHLYLPSAKEIALVEVPEMKFIMIDGRGDPNTSEEYKEALQMLYGFSYTLKFSSKLGDGPDWTVPPLEGLWWVDDGPFDVNAKNKFKWTSMIMQPDFVTSKMYLKAKEELKEKKNPPGLDKARLEKFNEGKSVQIMHIGPYDKEGPTIERMHSWAEENGYKIRGKHHELYISDPRRTAPEKLKTVIRHPVKKSS